MDISSGLFFSGHYLNHFESTYQYYFCHVTGFEHNTII